MHYYVILVGEIGANGGEDMYVCSNVRVEENTRRLTDIVAKAYRTNPIRVKRGC